MKDIRLYGIDMLYHERAEELSKLDHDDRTIEKQTRESLEKLITSVKAMNFGNTLTERLLDEVEKVTDAINSKTTYYQEKYYKQGFSDGVTLLFDCLKME